MITIKDSCIGCEKCIPVCPVDALKIEGKLAVVDEELCISCGVCVSVCPVNAIEPVLMAKKADFSKYSGVWIFAEQHAGKLKPSGPELLGKGRELADEVGEELCAVLIGKDVNGLTDELKSYGADKIYVVEGDEYKDYSTEAYTTAMVTLISKYKPSMVLYGATHLGRDLAPSVAGHLGLGLTADCTGLSITEVEDRKVLLQTRPAFGGNVMADIICPNTRPQMATVRPHVMIPLEPDDSKSADVIKETIPVSPDAIKTEIIEVLEPEDSEEVSVDEADVVITGGRGVGNDLDSFEILEELAVLLKGTVGCSRPIVEADILSKSKQVGQSGKTISPELYMVCGVSGAVQHRVGIRGSKYIIAINKDPKAPIFDMADFGIIGDLHKILPILKSKIEQKKSSEK